MSDTVSIWNTTIGYLIYFIFGVLGIFILCGIGVLIFYLIEKCKERERRIQNRLLEVNDRTNV